MFRIIQRYYKRGYYTKEDVKVFVISGDITAEQYKKITNDDYAE